MNDVYGNGHGLACSRAPCALQPICHTPTLPLQSPPGKSSLLNALLGEEDILPTNAMRASTGCPIEVRGRRDVGRVDCAGAAQWRLRFIWVRKRADAGPYLRVAERHVCFTKPET